MQNTISTYLWHCTCFKLFHYAILFFLHLKQMLLHRRLLSLYIYVIHVCTLSPYGFRQSKVINNLSIFFYHLQKYIWLNLSCKQTSSEKIKWYPWSICLKCIWEFLEHDVRDCPTHFLSLKCIAMKCEPIKFNN